MMLETPLHNLPGYGSRGRYIEHPDLVLSDGLGLCLHTLDVLILGQNDPIAAAPLKPFDVRHVTTSELLLFGDHMAAPRAKPSREPDVAESRVDEDLKRLFWCPVDAWQLGALRCLALRCRVPPT